MEHSVAQDIAQHRASDDRQDAALEDVMRPPKMYWRTPTSQPPPPYVRAVDGIASLV